MDAASDTLAGILAASDGSAPALVGTAGTLSYAELLATVRSVSAWLVDSGVAPGSRVAIVQRDGPWAALMLLGVSYAHAAAPLNPNLSAEDYAFITSDFGVAVVVAETGVVDEARLAGITAPVLPFTAWSFRPTADEGAPAAATPEAPAFLLHTSGTTARPKKVVLTQGRIARSARVIAGALRLGPSDRCLTGMPMFHVHGILNALASTLASGGSFVHAGPFDTLAFYGNLRKFRPTWITAVPTMYHAIAGRPELVPPDHQVRFIRSSSAPMSDVLCERLEDLFGVAVLSSYGMTEIDPIACVPFGEKQPLGAVGRPSGVDVRLVGADGRDIARDDDLGSMGEVWVRGPRVIPAYEASDEVNAAAFADGWFKTGDLGRWDADGWLHLSGRSKEIINRGGEKVAPLEIDAVLLRHPDVVEAAAFGTPDAARGEEIAAAVVLVPQSTLTEDGLRAWLAERLAFHKCPRHLQFVPALPKGPTGKLLRNALRLAPTESNAAGGTTGGTTRDDDTLVALVRSVWVEILELPDVAPTDRFMDIGGSSYSAMEILVRLSERLDRTLPIDVLLDGDTPVALAAAIRRYTEARP